jgi:cation diffusion facilitator CzcD-associated flavoprotein CzcO
MNETFDILVIGAGISGISAGYHLKTFCPDKSFALLEARSAIGGTWDLFRYPGVRSDSDMHTFGFSFRPWTDPESIADAPAILRYLNETIDAFGLRDHIRLNHQLKTAAWDSKAARWTLTVERDGAVATLLCRFLIFGTGYYSYTAPHQPDFPNQSAFKGQVIHPQFWPENVDYAGRRVIVIGSGATAATLVPAMAADAARVIMLQRSPTYMIARPRQDGFANALRKILPDKIAYAINRTKNVRQQRLLYLLSRKYPRWMARKLRDAAQAMLGPGFDVATHFTPRYAPWDQRMCLVPDGDLFTAIAAGKAEVMTDTIQCFTPDGILLESGRELAADLIVTATGITMEFMSGIVLNVDGHPVPIRRAIAYKGCMFSGLPNLVSLFGYANASWTLRADLIARFATRLINHMDKKRFDYVVPDATGILATNDPLMPLSSGYATRAAPRLPKQGDKDPWRVHHNYYVDRKQFRLPLDDGSLGFRQAG